ncbi:MAG TPA: SRPBCC domain-containing protein [Solirubrobacteraceae bacterium]|nr:SRPBCC domain-containing protein [Solirubrobacteraceae bacterium]
MVPSYIERETVIAAPIDVVWGVLTDPGHIATWFADTAELDLRPGGAGRLVWTGRHTAELRVEQVDPPHRFSFRWESPSGTEPVSGNSLLVEFTLIADGEGTRLRVVESGLRELDWSDERKSGYAEDHAEGWKTLLGRLAELAPQRVREAARS